MNRHIPRLLAIGLPATLLAGCASLTGDSFTFEGQLPANFRNQGPSTLRRGQ